MMRNVIGLVLVVFLGSVYSCSSTVVGAKSCSTAENCPSEMLCIDGKCMAPPADAGGQACISDSDCGEGIGKCLDGVCCASVENVCGSQCCGSDAICFGSTCVVPGDVCTTSTNCSSGEYCERGLGTGGEIDAGVQTCGSSAGSGRCIAFPPECATPPSGAPCVLASCEIVHQDSEGPLNAVPQWRWGPDNAVEEPARVDVWSTPVVGRVFDTNCDGIVSDLDSAAILFVSNDTHSRACHGAADDKCRTGILRALDGLTGRELWSLSSPGGTSLGFAGVVLALGDLDGDGTLDIVAVTAEQHLVAVKGDGTVMGIGSDVLPVASALGLGWGGGLALGDMDGDGKVEVAWRGGVYTWEAGTFNKRFEVPSARGGWNQHTVSTSLSFFANLDADSELELLAGNTAINADGSILWQRSDLEDGFAAIADFDGTQPITPEVVLVTAGNVYLLNAATGAPIMGPTPIGGVGFGGPPTVADFDGDGRPEIGVAQANVYAMLKPNYLTMTIDVGWTKVNHDNSSSVTGSTVFDFEGDGIAEVIYNDECYMWVFDGRDGRVRFSAPTDSFTGTESSLVADVDGDGHAEMVMIANGADPTRWHCAHHSTADANYPAWSAPGYGPAWRGISVFRDVRNAWVGTRSLWTQHAYHVTNTCSGRDSACSGPDNSYGAVPKQPLKNWEVSWLNNFRQNVAESGIFDAPDAVIDLRVTCDTPMNLIASVRNQGRSPLPAGVEVGFFQDVSGNPQEIGRGVTTSRIGPGGVEEISFDAPVSASASAVFTARILIDPLQPSFEECDSANNTSSNASAMCID